MCCCASRGTGQAATVNVKDELSQFGLKSSNFQVTFFFPVKPGRTPSREQRDICRLVDVPIFSLCEYNNQINADDAMKQPSVINSWTNNADVK